MVTSETVNMPINKSYSRWAVVLIEDERRMVQLNCRDEKCANKLHSAVLLLSTNSEQGVDEDE